MKRLFCLAFLLLAALSIWNESPSVAFTGQTNGFFSNHLCIYGSDVDQSRLMVTFWPNGLTGRGGCGWQYPYAIGLRQSNEFLIQKGLRYEP